MIAGLVLVSLGAVMGFFLFKNGQWVVLHLPVVELDMSQPFNVVEYETPLAAVMALSFVVGCVAMMLVFAPSRLRRAVERRRERRFIDELQGELSDLRNLPLSGPAPLEDLKDEKDTKARRNKGKPELDDEAVLMAALQGEDSAP